MVVEARKSEKTRKLDFLSYPTFGSFRSEHSAWRRHDGNRWGSWKGGYV